MLLHYIEAYRYRNGATKKSDALILKPTKKVVVFFIGGAGDKESFYGMSASNINK